MKRRAAILLAIGALGADPAGSQTRADSAAPAFGYSELGEYLFGGAPMLGYVDGTGKPKQLPDARFPASVGTPQTPALVKRSGAGSTDGPAIDGVDLLTPKSGLPQVPTTAALGSYASYALPVRRAFFASPGDAGGATFYHVATACSIGGGDGGSQVPAADGGCWLTAEPILSPQQFGAVGAGNDDQATINAAAAAAARLNRTFRIPAGGYALSQPLQVTPALNVQADPGAVFNAFNNAALGINVQAGNYSTYLRFPALGLFATGLQLSGASLLKAFVPYVGGSTIAVLKVSAAGQLLDNVLDIDDIFNSTYGVVVKCASTADTIQGNHDYVNFITETQKPYAYTGPGCSNDGNALTAEAIDITADKGGGALISNEQASGYVPRATLEVKTWAGGNAFDPAQVQNGAAPAQLVSGSFSELLLDLRSTRQWLAANQSQGGTPSCLLCDIRLHRALNGTGTAVVNLDTTGTLATQSASFTGSIVGNTLTVTAVASGTLAAGEAVSGSNVPSYVQVAAQASGTTGGAGTYTLNATLSSTVSSETMTAAPSFFGGQPVDADAFNASLTLPNGLAQGALVDFFYYVLFPDQFASPWSCHVSSGLSPSTSLIGQVDENAAYKGRIRLRVTNYTSASLPPGSGVGLRCARHLVN